MPNPTRLALYWLGVQAVWGALLGISLQSRTLELASSGALIWYGRLATGGACIAAVVQICAGVWSDNRRGGGSRRVEFYIVGAIAGSASLFAFYEAHTLVQLAAGFVAVQIALNVAGGPYQAIIPDFVERSRIGIASSWMAALQSVGNAAGALIASFIVPARALAAALSALLLATCAATTFHVRTLQLQTVPPAARRRTSRAFVDLFISRALMYVGFYTLLGYLLFYVSTTLGAALGDAKRETGILIVLFTVVGALGAGIAAKPTDRWDKRIVASAGAAAFIVALGWFIGAHSTLQIVAATVIAGAGWGIFLVADWAIACRVLPAQSMASGMGVWNLAIVLPQIAAPAVTTVVLQRLGQAASPGGPRVAFTLALGETLLGATWLWRLSHSAIGE